MFENMIDSQTCILHLRGMGSKRLFDRKIRPFIKDIGSKLTIKHFISNKQFKKNKLPCIYVVDTVIFQHRLIRGKLMVMPHHFDIMGYECNFSIYYSVSKYIGFLLNNLDICKNNKSIKLNDKEQSYLKEKINIILKKDVILQKESKKIKGGGLKDLWVEEMRNTILNHN